MNNMNMNGKRHMKYRKSIYRKRRIRAIIIISAIILALLIAVFLIIGNVFFDKANKDSDMPETTSSEVSSLPTLPSDSARQIKGTAISLRDGLSSLSSSLDSVIDSGASEISVMMTTPDGKLTHHSDIAERMKYSIFNDNAVSLTSLIERADDRSLYVSGVYYISAFSEEDDLARSVLIAELATVISEAFQTGLDEAVLLAPDISKEQYSEILHLISEIRAFVPNAKVGFALPKTLVESNDAKAIDELAMSVSFLALDLTGYGDTAPQVFAQERISSMLYYLIRYKMRIILPSLEDSEIQNSVISTVESSGIYNWQTIK